MKTTSSIAMMACLAAGAVQAENWIPLFNGKSLDGWKLHPKSVGHWKVVDDVIDYDALSEAPNLNDKHLWTDESFGDFELHVDWRIKETHGLYPVPTILPDGSHKKETDGSYNNASSLVQFRNVFIKKL